MVNGVKDKKDDGENKQGQKACSNCGRAYCIGHRQIVLCDAKDLLKKDNPRSNTRPHTYLLDGSQALGLHNGFALVNKARQADSKSATVGS
jgi:hypothetical protein